MTSRTALAALLAASLLTPSIADACSRAVYFGKDGQTVTGRTMDWASELNSNLWVYPRGLARTSGTKTPLTWTSKYGSVVTTIYEGAAADGMNEKGLVANLLYLAEAKYQPATPTDRRPTVPITAWVQYVLDHYATTAEAVAALRKEEFRVVPIIAPSGEPGTVHLSISDPSGDSAILEFIDGKLVIHHGKQFQVMTNSPTYHEQLALNAYWAKIGGNTFLPGTHRAADRFVRLSHYVNATEQSADAREAVATVFSIMRNVSVPLGVTVPGAPNLAETQWLSVADQKNRVYYYQGTNSPGIVWTRLDKLDFSPGSGARRLLLVGNPDVAGDQTANYKREPVFNFLVPQD